MTIEIGEPFRIGSFNLLPMRAFTASASTTSDMLDRIEESVDWLSVYVRTGSTSPHPMPDVHLSSPEVLEVTSKTSSVTVPLPCRVKSESILVIREDTHVLVKMMKDVPREVCYF